MKLNQRKHILFSTIKVFKVNILKKNILKTFFKASPIFFIFSTFTNSRGPRGDLVRKGTTEGIEFYFNFIFEIPFWSLRHYNKQDISYKGTFYDKCKYNSLDLPNSVTFYVENSKHMSIIIILICIVILMIILI